MAVTGVGGQVMMANPVCHTMPMTPVEVEMNYLHDCSNGPLTGRYLTLARPTVTKEVINLVEVVVWEAAQPEDFSDHHGVFLKTVISFGYAKT